MSLRQFIIGTSGIYLSYLTISVISQKLYSKPYPSISNPQQSHKFNYPCLIVWFSSFLCALFSFIKGIVTNESSNPIQVKQQMILGLLFTLNMLCANYALLYITYLQQAIGRNCRYLMVVIIGAYFSRVKKGSGLKLDPKKILVAAIITIGVLGFTVAGESKHKKEIQTKDESWKGYLMLIVSIIADALFSDSQAYAKFKFKPSQNHLFAASSTYSFVFVLIFSFLVGQVFDQIYFCIDHPTVIGDLLIMSVLQVVGQISIFYIIGNFKQHIFPLISTTRKVFTVLLSIFLFGHKLAFLQWIAILFVFGGLAYQLQEQLSAKKQKNAVKQQETSKKNEINMQKKSSKKGE